jgi:hypothetical protein
MMSRFSITLLLFTFFASLASGQWEADQFLFDKAKSPSRPKPINGESKKETVSDKKGKTLKADVATQPAKIPPALQPSVPAAPRDPAAIQDATVSINARMGYVDFLSQSSGSHLDFSRGAYSVGAHLGIGIDPMNSVQISYVGTAELQSAIDWNGQSVSHLKWEDLGFQYSYRLSVNDNELYVGPLYRRNTWWAQIAGKRLSLERIETYGAQVLYQFPKKEKIQQQLQWQGLPFARSLESHITGYDVSAEWILNYDLSPKRTLVLHLGAEKLQLSGDANQQSELDQRIMKAFVGYKISTQ